MALFEEAVRHLENVDVRSFSGLVVNYARQTESQVIVRGLRAVPILNMNTRWRSLTRNWRRTSKRFVSSQAWNINS